MKQELIGCQSFHMVNCSISSGQKNRRPGSQKQFSVSNIEEVYGMLIATVFEADESESSRQDILAGWLLGPCTVVRHQSYLVPDSVLDRQPVKTSQYRRDVFGSAGADHRAGQRILETLELIDVALGSTVEDTVAVIDASSYQSTGDGPLGITVNESADVSKSPYVESGWTADAIDVLVEI